MNKYSVTFVDPVVDDRWNRFTEAHPSGSIYHHSCWMQVIQKTYNYEPCYLAVKDERDCVQGVLPLFFVDSWLTGKRVISLPFSPYGGPLTTNPENLDVLLEALENHAKLRNAAYVQLRCAMESISLNRREYLQDEYYKIHILDLRPEVDALMGGFHKSCIRRPILKSLKNGLVLRIAETEEDLQAFYQLQLQTRKKHGIPPQPLEYFQNMWRILRPLNYMKLLMALYGSQVVAAMVLLQFKDMIVYQNGASDPRFLSLKPNHFLLWKAIEMSKAEGFQFFNFGKSSPQDKGLIEFKQRWGTKEYSLSYYYYPKVKGKTTNIETSRKYRLVTSICQHLPPPLLKRIGEIVYRHLA